MHVVLSLVLGVLAASRTVYITPLENVKITGFSVSCSYNKAGLLCVHDLGTWVTFQTTKGKCKMAFAGQGPPQGEGPCFFDRYADGFKVRMK
jgi:hypothetical protein